MPSEGELTLTGTKQSFRSDICRGLGRSDELADLGIYCAEHDSKPFAGKLVDAVSDDRPIRDLEHVITAFQAELYARKGESG